RGTTRCIQPPHRCPGRDTTMEIEKDQVVDLLRARGEHDRAQQVDCALPRHVDTDKDAGLLHTFDINIGDLPSDWDGQD
ncbi:MAG TPA: hypothetical protein VFG63_06870, partial [Nocardioidaceae bacterium]|nr:hypothetical protein [Nocardioidaceae bacterium]